MIQNVYLIITTVLALAVAALGWFLFDARKKILMLFGGKETEKEGEFLRDIVRRLAKNEAKLEEFAPRIEKLETISKISVQKVGFMRFNPFHDTGGDQSFILVLLDRENNGVLLSSLYAREGARVYAKSIGRGKSKHPLSEEERSVLDETVTK